MYLPTSLNLSVWTVFYFRHQFLLLNSHVTYDLDTGRILFHPTLFNMPIFIKLSPLNVFSIALLVIVLSRYFVI